MGNFQSPSLIGRRQEQGELLTAIACSYVIRPPGGLRQYLSKLSQGIVARLVPRGVIESLEIIEIKQLQRHRLTRPTCAPDGALKGLIECAAIGDASQPVCLSDALQIAVALPELDFVYCHSNSGQALNVVAALALKEIMEREKIPGTIMLWPGVAEELLGGKAYMVRDGVFNGVDAVLFTHVGNNLQTAWGQPNGTGMVSVEYTFSGESAHSAMAPWRGRSALDGVELMNIAWNMRREHLRPEQRSHYVIPNGGDQPNVVPSVASVWYFIREQDFENIRKSFDVANTIAEAAAKMTDTTVTRQVIGTAAPRHFNKPIAEATYANIQQVGLPQWTEDEQAFAKAVQRTVKGKEEGLAVELKKFEPPVEKPQSGGSDDIGDISWTVPTITLNYPSNIPNLPGHHWSNAMSMATPIAHKGVVAGSKVIAMTVIDLLSKPELLIQAKQYFATEQQKNQKYVPMISAEDKPQVQINANVMATYRPEMKKYYYDPSKYATYLDQLGIKFPVLEKPKN